MHPVGRRQKVALVDHVDPDASRPHVRPEDEHGYEADRNALEHVVMIKVAMFIQVAWCCLRLEARLADGHEQCIPIRGTR